MSFADVLVCCCGEGFWCHIPEHDLFALSSALREPSSGAVVGSLVRCQQVFYGVPAAWWLLQQHSDEKATTALVARDS